jgi:hypothetical protein
MDAIKGASAHKINRLLERSGKVWQTECFDRVLRSSEKLDEKMQYILDNPVRKGLVSAGAEYRWLWRRELGSPVPSCARWTAEGGLSLRGHLSVPH